MGYYDPNIGKQAQAAQDFDSAYKVYMDMQYVDQYEKKKLMAKADKAGIGDALDAIQSGDYSQILGENAKYADAVMNLFSKNPQLATRKASEIAKEISNNGAEGIEEAKGTITSAVYGSLLAAERTDFKSKISLIKILDDMSGLMEQVPSDYVKGSIQDVVTKLGGLGDENLRLIGQKMDMLVNIYTLGQSGVQFSTKEMDMYKKIFPSNKKVSAANIQDVMNLTSTWKENLNEQIQLSTGNTLYLEDLVPDYMMESRYSSITGDPKYASLVGSTTKAGDDSLGSLWSESANIIVDDEADNWFQGINSGIR
jgi:hypothetical protein